jgi:hypothetical protein
LVSEVIRRFLSSRRRNHQSRWAGSTPVGKEVEVEEAVVMAIHQVVEEEVENLIQATTTVPQRRPKISMISCFSLYNSESNKQPIHMIQSRSSWSSTSNEHSLMDKILPNV